ncbi:MAG: DUF4325 domain-containing protein [Treponema sp.]|jgi:hypothetical protein|nr:DUF4325 domain-containing protein [Treponema sp.]
MPGIRKRGEEIRDFILRNITDVKSIAAVTAKQFNISLPAVYKHIDRLAVDKLIVKKQGKYIIRSEKFRYNFKINKKLSEDGAWENDIKMHFADNPQNIKSIWVYGFLEIFNNAIEHSKGNEIRVNIEKNKVFTTLSISDNGIGIFINIKNKFRLLDEKDALLELAKGKRTTDKTRHSGQGIFFTSKVFDEFAIVSNGIIFAPKKDGNSSTKAGVRQSGSSTLICMSLANDSGKMLKNVFDEFSTEIPGDFDRTIVPVHLANSDDLVSRSQARRVLSGLELFREVILDFQDVKYIGQAFADEIFRVFPNMYPAVKIIEANSNPDVQNMINRARNTKV